MKVKALLILTVAALAAAFLYRHLGAARTTRTPPPPLWSLPSLKTLLDASGTKGREGITIITPGSGLRGDDIEKAYAIAEKLGVIFPAGSLKPEAVPYTANTDEARLRMLIEALNNPDAEVLWALRGGYGSGRLLPELAALPAPGKKKIFIGYSDMTFLYPLFEKWDWRTVHGAMFWELSLTEEEKDPENFLRLAELLSGKTTELRYDGLIPFNLPAREQSAPIESTVRGGNLTCVAAATGTPWQVNAGGGIIFLEDVKERGYKLDRMLTQLRLSGVFDNAGAVVLGEFTRGDDNVEFALKRFAEECPAPVFRSDLFGHGRKNYPLIFNSPAVIEKTPDTGESFTLRIDARLLP